VNVGAGEVAHAERDEPAEPVVERLEVGDRRAVAADRDEHLHGGADGEVTVEPELVAVDLGDPRGGIGRGSDPRRRRHDGAGGHHGGRCGGWLGEGRPDVRTCRPRRREGRDDERSVARRAGGRAHAGLLAPRAPGPHDVNDPVRPEVT